LYIAEEKKKSIGAVTCITGPDIINSLFFRCGGYVVNFPSWVE